MSTFRKCCLQLRVVVLCLALRCAMSVPSNSLRQGASATMEMSTRRFANPEDLWILNNFKGYAGPHSRENCCVVVAVLCYPSCLARVVLSLFVLH